jgi:hypothetical protein
MLILEGFGRLPNKLRRNGTVNGRYLFILYHMADRCVQLP